ncbi:hypothetical protein Y032_0449g1660 [Ancylostoma ceylanicum]|uniref:Uncharacterized protein n=1 Tax=Ancylostoma ceylanicum TaxID=53326 RepID=A0A016WZV2_9BILA|nr:hypothetical protein Y032_0449g1660 [Ancylostoma ceylanicum]
MCCFSTYARKASAVAKYLRGRPAAARAEVSHWVKLVAEQGRMDHLVMRSRDMSFIQYFCLDIIAYLLAQFFTALYLVFKVGKYILRRFRVFFVKCKSE